MHPGNKLIIETPEQTAVEFPLAGVGSRGVALLLDTLLQVGTFVIMGAIAGIVSLAGFFPQIGRQWVFGILIVAAFLVQFGYFAFFETIWNGQTPGKRWTHLRVIADSGRPITSQNAILRNLVRIVDSLPTLYAVGIITSLVSRENKRVGDYLAGTVVVHEKARQGGMALWNTSSVSQISAAPRRALSPGELQLVDAFLERRHSFTEDVRRGMARQIAERVSRGNSPEEAAQTGGHDPEKYLESLAEHSRKGAHFR